MKRRLLINWISTLGSTLFLFSLLAAPVAAVVAANTINSAAIIDGQVKTPDLGTGSVTTAKLRDGSVKSIKIANGSVKNADVADTAAISASKINRLGLNADLLDGFDSAAFSKTTHNHNSLYWTPDNDGSGSGLDADLIDGKDSAAFAEAIHSHDSTQTEVVGIPASALAKHSVYDFYLEDGWAYGLGSGWAYADVPLTLPNGAIIESVESDILDNSGGYDARIMLYRWSPEGLEFLSEEYSAGASTTWGVLTETVISSATVDNSKYGYFVQVRLHGPSASNIAVGSTRVTYSR